MKPIIKIPDPDRMPDREPFTGLFQPFERMIDPFRPYEGTRPPEGLVAFLKWSLADVRWPIVLLAIFALAVGATEGLVFYLIGGLVDRATAAGPADVFAQEWPWLLSLFVLVVFGKPLVQLGQSAMTSLALGPGLNPMTIWRLHRHTLGQSMRFFEEDFTGRIAQKQTQTSTALTSVVVDSLSSLGMLAAYIVTITLLLASAGVGVLGVAVGRLGPRHVLVAVADGAHHGDPHARARLQQVLLLLGRALVALVTPDVVQALVRHVALERHLVQLLAYLL